MISTTPARPACFDSDTQWLEWRALLVRSNAKNRDAEFSYCRDCTHEYKAEMVRAGRCGNRWGVLVQVDDDEVEGEE